jgi:hypothetical protein
MCACVSSAYCLCSVFLAALSSSGSSSSRNLTSQTTLVYLYTTLSTQEIDSVLCTHLHRRRGLLEMYLDTTVYSAHILHKVSAQQCTRIYT